MEVFFCLLIFFVLCFILLTLNKNKLLKKRIINLAQNAIEYTPQEFFDYQKKLKYNLYLVFIIRRISYTLMKLIYILILSLFLLDIKRISYYVDREINKNSKNIKPIINM